MSVTTPSLPSSWAEVPLSAIAVVNPRGSNTELPDETVVSFLPMKAVAEHLNRPINAIARLERGIVHDTDLATRYHAWLDTHGAA